MFTSSNDLKNSTVDTLQIWKEDTQNITLETEDKPLQECEVWNSSDTLNFKQKKEALSFETKIKKSGHIARYLEHPDIKKQMG